MAAYALRVLNSSTQAEHARPRLDVNMPGSKIHRFKLPAQFGVETQKNKLKIKTVFCEIVDEFKCSVSANTVENRRPLMIWAMPHSQDSPRVEAK
jgi:hypothetical protein